MLIQTIYYYVGELFFFRSTASDEFSVIEGRDRDP